MGKYTQVSKVPHKNLCEYVNTKPTTEVKCNRGRAIYGIWQKSVDFGNAHLCQFLPFFCITLSSWGSGGPKEMSGIFTKECVNYIV